MSHISLDDIEREAALLEIDVNIVDGHFLNMTKRGDPSMFYRSIQTLSDPRVMVDAWRWLQEYRASLRRSDEARTQIGKQHPRRKALRNKSNLLYLAHFFPSVIGGIATYLILVNHTSTIVSMMRGFAVDFAMHKEAGSILAAYVVFGILLCFTTFLRAISKRRAAKNGKPY